MATAGVQVVNQFGTLLFDENYSNICLRYKGNAQVDWNGAVNPGPNFPYQGVYPLFALTGNHTYRAANSYINSDGTVHGYGTIENGTPGVWRNIDYYEFDVPSGVSNSGIVVYKANGQVAFDAMKQYLRVVDVRSGTAGPNGVTGGGTFTYPSGRKYAICIIKGSYTDHEFTTTGTDDMGRHVFGTVTEYWQSTFQLTNNQLVIGQMYYEDPFDDNGLKGVSHWNRSPQWSVAIIDVTGY